MSMDSCGISSHLVEERMEAATDKSGRQTVTAYVRIPESERRFSLIKVKTFDSRGNFSFL